MQWICEFKRDRDSGEFVKFYINTNCGQLGVGVEIKVSEKSIDVVYKRKVFLGTVLQVRLTLKKGEVTDLLHPNPRHHSNTA